MAKQRKPYTRGNDCRHCHQHKSAPQAYKNGLCPKCYNDAEIRVLYKGDERYHEPTPAELDAMIAEQSKCKPAWWQKSWEKMAQGDRAE